MPPKTKPKKLKSEAECYVERHHKDFEQLFTLSRRAQDLANPLMVAQIQKIKDIVQSPEHLALIRNPVELGTSIHILRRVYQQVIDVYFFYLQQQGCDPMSLLAVQPNLLGDLIPFLNGLVYLSSDLEVLSRGFAFIALHITSLAKHPETYSELEADFALAKELFKKLRAAETLKNTVLSKEYCEKIELDTYHMMNDVYMTVCTIRPDLQSLASVMDFLDQTRRRGLYWMETHVLGLCYVATTKYPDFVFLERSLKSITSADASNQLTSRQLTLIYGAFLSVYAALAKVLTSVEEGRLLSEKQCIGLLFSFNYMERFITKAKPETLPSFLQQRTPYGYYVFSILMRHKNILSGGIHKTLYTQAQSMLEDKVCLDEAQQKDLILNMVLLLANNKIKVELAEVRSLYAVFVHELGQSKELLSDHLVTILLQVKNYNLEDYRFILQILCESNRTQSQLYQLLQRFIAMSEPDKNELYAEFVILCKQHHALIASDPELLQLLAQHFDASFLVEAQQDAMVLREKTNYDRWQTVRQNIIHEVQTKVWPAYWSKPAQALEGFLNSASGHCDFEKKTAQLETLWEEYKLFFELISQAQDNHIPVKLFIRHLTNTLKEDILEVGKVIELRASCEKMILAHKEQRNLYEAVPLKITNAHRILARGSLEDLEKLNRWLHTPAPRLELYLIKIKCLIKLERYDEALLWLPKALQTFPGQQEKALHLAWAACCKALGQYQDALNAYQHIARLEKSVGAFSLTAMNMAFCHQQLGSAEHFTQALAIYTQLLGRNLASAERTQVLQAQAHCYMKNNQFTKAQEIITSLRIEPKTQALQGHWYFMQHHYPQAINCYETALASEYNLKWLKSLLQCYSLSSQFSEEKKAAVLALVEQNEEKTVEYLSLKVLLLMQVEAYDRALIQLDAINKEWGKTLFTYLQRALCYRALNRHHDAIALLTAYPGYYHNKLVLKHLAVTYAMVNKQEEALHCFDYLMSEYPAYGAAYLKAIAYGIRINDRDRVQAYWEQCKEYIQEDHLLIAQLQRLVDPYLAMIHAEERNDLQSILLQVDSDDSRHCAISTESGEKRELITFCAHEDIIDGEQQNQTNSLMATPELAFFKPQRVIHSSSAKSEDKSEGSLSI